jgi:tRNA pseudouridine55 synthase
LKLSVQAAGKETFPALQLPNYLLQNYQIRVNGVLIIDKSSGLTSHDVVHRARRILGQRSVGHLGTLDPMATGVLPLVIGGFTRLAQFYLSSEKTYEGTIRFGFATDTYDAEGEPTSMPATVALSREEVDRVATRFRGVLSQTPPPFSAKKIKGIPAYKLARKQKEVRLEPVEVKIKEFEILSVESDRAHFRAHVGAGTYMRSVAHDMGQMLGCGAHLESLRRTAVAEFTLADAHTLDELENAGLNKHPHHGDPDWNLAFIEGEPSGVEGPGASTDLEALFIHPRKLLPSLPSVTADEIAVAHIRNGRAVNLPELSRARQVKVFSGQRDLIGIATRVAGTLFQPKIVLCNS